MLSHFLLLSLNALLVILQKYPIQCGASDCNGCQAGGTSCYDFNEYGAPGVYACKGTFSGGMESTSAKALCSDGYDICRATRAKDLGMAPSMCNNIPNTEVYFAQETSNNNVGQCYAQYGPGTVKLSSII